MGPLKNRLARLREKLALGPVAASDRPLFILVAAVMLASLMIMGGGGASLFLKQRAKTAHLRATRPAPEEPPAETKDGTPLFHIARDIPKEILDRQDGIPEPGYDLAEPEIRETRGLASLIKDPPAAPFLPNRFVALDEIFSGTKVGRRAGGAVIAEIVLEVDTPAAEQEVTALKSQFRSVIASIMSEAQQSQLKTFEGKAQLKQRIQKELNLRLKQGRVNDVLFTNFVIR